MKNFGSFLPAADAVRLRAEVTKTVFAANQSVPACRRVNIGAADTVVNRSLVASSGLASSLRHHLALVALSRYIDLAQHNRTKGQFALDTDLLPVSHPRSTREHALTASALRVAQARWISSDPMIDDDHRPLVAAALASAPGSVEHFYAVSRLEAAQDGIALRALVASFGDGNSSAARSARARRQRRDRKGRFAWMGGGLKNLVRRLSGQIESLTGRFIKESDDGESFEFETPDGSIYRVKASNAEAVKAVLQSGDRPDGYAGVPAVVQTGDPITDEKDLVKLPHPSGYQQIGEVDDDASTMYGTTEGDDYRVKKFFGIDGKPKFLVTRNDGNNTEVGFYDNWTDAHRAIVKDGKQANKNDAVKARLDGKTGKEAEYNDFLGDIEVEAANNGENRILANNILSYFNNDPLAEDDTPAALAERVRKAAKFMREDAAELSDGEAKQNMLDLADDFDDAAEEINFREARRANAKKQQVSEASRPDISWDVPKGGYDLSRDEIDDFVPGLAKRPGNDEYTDDPAELAQNYDTDELRAALTQALTNPRGVGRLEFDGTPEPVQAPALYKALEERGVDADMEVARIYDAANGNDSNQKKVAAARKGEPVAILPEPSQEVGTDVVGQILQQVKDNGGLSVNMVDGSLPQEGFMVAKGGNYGEIVDATDFFDPEKGKQILRDFYRKHRDVLANGDYLGLWHETSRARLDENGNHVLDAKGEKVYDPIPEADQKVYLDVAENIIDRNAAEQAGRDRNQISIWDVVNQDEISTGGDGAVGTPAGEGVGDEGTGRDSGRGDSRSVEDVGRGTGRSRGSSVGESGRGDEEARLDSGKQPRVKPVDIKDWTDAEIDQTTPLDPANYQKYHDPEIADAAEKLLLDDPSLKDWERENIRKMFADLRAGDLDVHASISRTLWESAKANKNNIEKYNQYIEQLNKYEDDHLVRMAANQSSYDQNSPENWNELDFFNHDTDEANTGLEAISRKLRETADGVREQDPALASRLDALAERLDNTREENFRLVNSFDDAADMVNSYDDAFDLVEREILDDPEFDENIKDYVDVYVDSARRATAKMGARLSKRPQEQTPSPAPEGTPATPDKFPGTGRQRVLNLGEASDGDIENELKRVGEEFRAADDQKFLNELMAWSVALVGEQKIRETNLSPEDASVARSLNADVWEKDSTYGNLRANPNASREDINNAFAEYSNAIDALNSFLKERNLTPPADSAESVIEPPQDRTPPRRESIQPRDLQPGDVVITERPNGREYFIVDEVTEGGENGKLIVKGHYPGRVQQEKQWNPELKNGSLTVVRGADVPPAGDGPEIHKPDLKDYLDKDENGRVLRGQWAKDENGVWYATDPAKQARYQADMDAALADAVEASKGFDDPTRGQTVTPEPAAPAAPRKPKPPFPPGAAPLQGRLAEIAREANGDVQKFRELLAKESVFVFDFETTGIVKDENGNMVSPGQPWAISVAKIDPMTGDVIEQKTIYMNPDGPLTDWAKGNLKDADGNPLTDEWLAGQRSKADGFAEVMDFLGENPVLIGHNVDFDEPILRENADNLGLPYNPAGVGDTMSLSRYLQRAEQFSKNDLSTLAKKYGIENPDWHNAENDAKTTGKILDALLKDFEAKGDPLDIDAIQAWHDGRVADFDNKKAVFEEAVAKAKAEELVAEAMQSDQKPNIDEAVAEIAAEIKSAEDMPAISPDDESGPDWFDQIGREIERDRAEEEAAAAADPDADASNPEAIDFGDINLPDTDNQALVKDAASPVDEAVAKALEGVTANSEIAALADEVGVLRGELDAAQDDKEILDKAGQLADALEDLGDALYDELPRQNNLKKIANNIREAVRGLRRKNRRRARGGERNRPAPAQPRPAAQPKAPSAPAAPAAPGGPPPSGSGPNFNGGIPADTPSSVSDSGTLGVRTPSGPGERARGVTNGANLPGAVPAGPDDEEAVGPDGRRLLRKGRENRRFWNHQWFGRWHNDRRMFNRPWEGQFADRDNVPLAKGDVVTYVGPGKKRRGQQGVVKGRKDKMERWNGLNRDYVLVEFPDGRVEPFVARNLQLAPNEDRDWRFLVHPDEMPNDTERWNLPAGFDWDEVRAGRAPQNTRGKNGELRSEDRDPNNIPLRPGDVFQKQERHELEGRIADRNGHMIFEGDRVENVMKPGRDRGLVYGTVIGKKYKPVYDRDGNRVGYGYYVVVQFDNGEKVERSAKSLVIQDISESEKIARKPDNPKASMPTLKKQGNDWVPDDSDKVEEPIKPAPPEKNTIRNAVKNYAGDLIDLAVLRIAPQMNRRDFIDAADRLGLRAADLQSAINGGADDKDVAAAARNLADGARQFGDAIRADKNNNGPMQNGKNPADALDGIADLLDSMADNLDAPAVTKGPDWSLKGYNARSDVKGREIKVGDFVEVAGLGALKVVKIDEPNVWQDRRTLTLEDKDGNRVQTAAGLEDIMPNPVWQKAKKNRGPDPFIPRDVERKDVAAKDIKVGDFVPMRGGNYGEVIAKEVSARNGAVRFKFRFADGREWEANWWAGGKVIDGALVQKSGKAKPREVAPATPVAAPSPQPPVNAGAKIVDRVGNELSFGQKVVHNNPKKAAELGEGVIEGFEKDPKYGKDVVKVRFRDGSLKKFRADRVIGGDNPNAQKEQGSRTPRPARNYEAALEQLDIKSGKKGGNIANVLGNDGDLADLDRKTRIMIERDLGEEIAKAGRAGNTQMARDLVQLGFDLKKLYLEENPPVEGLSPIGQQILDMDPADVLKQVKDAFGAARVRRVGDKIRLKDKIGNPTEWQVETLEMGAIGYTFFLVHDSGERFIFKKENDQSYAAAEVVGAAVARGLGIAGATYVTLHPKDPYVNIQTFAGANLPLDGGAKRACDYSTPDNKRDNEAIPLIDATVFGLLDAVIWNRDRHGKNYLLGHEMVDGEYAVRPLPIDMGLAQMSGGEGIYDVANPPASEARQVWKNVDPTVLEELADMSFQQLVQYMQRYADPSYPNAKIRRMAELIIRRATVTEPKNKRNLRYIFGIR